MCVCCSCSRCTGTTWMHMLRRHIYTLTDARTLVLTLKNRHGQEERLATVCVEGCTPLVLLLRKSFSRTSHRNCCPVLCSPSRHCAYKVLFLWVFQVPLDMVQSRVRDRFAATVTFVALIAVILYLIFVFVFVDPTLRPNLSSTLGRVCLRSLFSRVAS